MAWVKSTWDARDLALLLCTLPSKGRKKVLATRTIFRYISQGAPIPEDPLDYQMRTTSDSFLHVRCMHVCVLHILSWPLAVVGLTAYTISPIG